jgi:iron complex transport system ATP-binding protein
VSALLSAHEVHASYGARTVLHGVTFAAQAGEVVALIGPNGAGKSTLLKVLAGIVRPTQGRVDAPEPRPRSIAYLAQSEELPGDWTVRDVVELGRLPFVGFWRDLGPDDRVAVARAMEQTATSELASRHVGELSGGERQRVALARAIAQEPRVLLLDEPTTHLDLRHQVDLFAVLRDRAAARMAVVAVMHDLAFAAHADRCVLLADGRVRADGTPSEALQTDVLGAVYDTDIEIYRGSDGRVAALAARSQRGGRST